MWRKVLDELPEEEVPVLIYVSNEDYWEYHQMIVAFWFFDEDCHWRTPNLILKWDEVSHWMPLPKEPV